MRCSQLQSNRAPRQPGQRFLCLATNQYRCLIVMAAMAGFSARTPAAVLLDDTFANGSRTSQSLPDQSAWFASSGVALTAATNALSLSLGSSAVLAVTYFGTNSGSPVALAIGDKLIATVRLSFIGIAPANTSQGFRLGLFDFANSTLSPKWAIADGFSSGSQGDGVQGYAVFQNMGAVFNNSSPINIRKRTTLADASLLGATGDYNSLASGPGNTNTFPGFTNGTLYTLQMALQRTGASNLTIVVTWSNTVNGATLSTTATDNAATNFNFDGIGLRPQSAALAATNLVLSEVKVEWFGAVTPPLILTQPQSLAVTVGQNAGFNVTASGAAPLSYQWFYQTNTPLPSGTNATLSLTNAQFADAGGYSVVITNNLGAVTSLVAMLTVNNPPVAPGISSQPQDLTVLAGQTSNFTVTATGSSPLTYQWYFNTNTPLANATNATLILTNIPSAAAGIYSVVVTNAAGSTNSRFAALTVNAPPTITAQPQSQAVGPGRNAAFAVAAAGTAPLAYQWFFNSVVPIAGAVGTTLLLTNLQTNDVGGYSVVVTNEFGSVTSAVALLTFGAPLGGLPNFDLVGFATFPGFDTFGYNQVQAGGVSGGDGGALVQVSTVAGFVNNLQSSATLMVEVMTNLDLSVLANNSGGFPANYPTGEILVRSNKTIFSRNGATISRGTLRLGKTSLGPQGNVIIRNLKFRDLWVFDPSGNYDTYGWDYIHLEEGSHHVWVDHCDLDQVYDGMLDLAHGSDYVTASWNVFRNQKKCSLIGHSDNNQSEDTNHLNVTFHHNYYVNVEERMPRMRFGNAHVFNLYSESLGGNGIQSTCGAATLVENSYFYHPQSGSLPTREENGGPTGTVKVVNSTIVNLPGVNVAFRQFGAANFLFNYPYATNAPPYPYTLDAVTNVPYLVTNFAGVGKVAPSILSPPQNLTVTAGQSATFNVTVIGANPMTFRWYFNTNTLVAAATNSSLTVAGAQAANAGGYLVVVSNLFGVATSIVASLTVQASNRPPVPGVYNAATGQETPVAIPLSALLAVGSDPDGDGLGVSDANPNTAAGGSVTLGGSALTYTPAVGFTGSDTVNYTLQDARGASATGAIAVSVVPISAIFATIAVPPSVIGGAFHVTLLGVPNLTYSVDRSTNVAGPWETLTNPTAGATGLFELTDPINPTLAQRYYRTRYP